MLILSQPKETHDFINTIRKTKKIAFVPTMGALHDGHLTLMSEAKKKSDFAVASIFVNPTQFNDPQDYAKYPRTLEEDLKKCRSVGVDLVFTPTQEDMYPAHESTKNINLPSVAKPMEGISRPGHFQGVVNIVYKLFQVVQPHLAFFGLKDYQQVRVIQEMVKQENLNIQIVPCPIVRTAEGLAMSSRNERLSEDGKKKALILNQSLKAAVACTENGAKNREREAKKIIQTVINTLRKEPEVIIDSVDLVDAETLLEIKTIEKPALLAIACFVEKVRLIDNQILMNYT